MAITLKQKTFHGIIWSAIERFSVQGIQFIIMIVMARVLMPSDYGMIGMLSIFMALGQTIIDSGFSNALIRKLDRNESDYSTVFYFNIIVGIILYLLLYLLSPYIAKFYNKPELIHLTKISALNLFFNSLSVVQRAKFTIQLNFRTQAKASLSAVLISGIVGISMAYLGYGVWALVWQSVLNSCIGTIMFWFLSRWSPKRKFSLQSFKSLFDFGSKLLVSGILQTIYRNIYSLVIGKKFTSSDLGYFTRAEQFAQYPSSNLTGIVQRVSYPVLSEIQHDSERFIYIYRKFLRLSGYIVFPLMIGVASIAHPLVNCLLTEKWNFTVLLLQILCFAYMWYPIDAINLNLLQVKGRSDLFLKLEIVKKIIGVVTLMLTIHLGIIAICYGLVFSSIMELVVDTYYTKKLINFGLWEQMKNLIPAIIYSLSMGGVILLIIHFIDSNIMKIFCGIVIGIMYYFLVSYFTKSQDLRELILLFKKK